MLWRGEGGLQCLAGRGAYCNEEAVAMDADTVSLAQRKGKRIVDCSLGKSHREDVRRGWRQVNSVCVREKERERDADADA